MTTPTDRCRAAAPWRCVLLAAVLLAAAGVWAAAGADPDRGAAEIVLEGGSSGPVAFPHRTHQEVVEDCMVCHSAFPQEAGSIERLKAAGELKKKQVMNKQCTACHKRMKREGGKTGPTTCKTCHASGK